MSRSWCEIGGYPREELATIGDWTERAYGERREPVLPPLGPTLGLGRAVGPGHRFLFHNRLVSLDATVITLCLSLFPWAEYTCTKGGVKLHALLRTGPPAGLRGRELAGSSPGTGPLKDKNA